MRSTYLSSDLYSTLCVILEEKWEVFSFCVLSHIKLNSRELKSLRLYLINAGLPLVRNTAGSL